MEQRYLWQRFWVSPGQTAALLSDRGFLLDPTGDMAHYVPQKAHTLAELRHLRALVLLGEPGIGKSFALQDAVTAERGADGNDVFIRVDLRSCSSDILLHNRVFKSTEFREWKQGSSHLFLYLDSLDEALLRIDNVASLLADELPEYPTARMSIRIACRTAVWPHRTLEPAFRRIWGDASVGVFELAPLRRRDVIDAAITRNLSADRFLKEVEDASAVSFAIKPLTLKLLFRIFDKHGQLPARIVDLYSEGCLSLCEEQSCSRVDAGRVGQLNVRQRYRLASRVAAVTMLGNRYAVWTGLESGEKPDEDISIPALSIGSETGDFQPFNVTDENLREVLDTGLYSSRGTARMGWAHQSYAEFLAAEYLVVKKTSVENIVKVLSHPSGGLIPQLWMVAAWVASRNEEVRSKLIAKEPIALLRGDVIGWSNDDLAALTRALLEAFEEQRALDPIGISTDYRKLAHPRLSNQLRPYILNRSKHLIARRAALMIAGACSVRELESEILGVALDGSDDPWVRAQAVSTLATCADEASKAQLLPVARGQIGPDANQEVKGHALQILWPNHVTSEDLFDLITPPVDGHIGTYVMFLIYQVPKSLSGAELIPALRWATDHVQRANLTGDFQLKQFLDAILVQAWHQPTDPTVMAELTRYVRAALSHLYEVILAASGQDPDEFRNRVRSDEQKRRSFLLSILMESEPLKAHEATSFMRHGFVQDSDLSWLLSISPHGAAPEPRINENSLLDLIDAAFDRDNPVHFELLYEIANAWQPLRRRYQWLLDGIQLDSPEAAQMARYQRQTTASRETQPLPLDPPPDERVRLDLEKFEAGETNAWWWLNGDLTLTPTSRHYNWLQCQITGTPGWASADERTRHKIVNIAGKYLKIGQPQHEKWLLKSSIQHADLSAYRALVLLSETDRETYGEIDARTWSKWAPVVVGVQNGVLAGNNESELHDQVAADAIAKAPEEFVHTVKRLIRTERRRSRARPQTSNIPPFWILRRLDRCWESTPLKDAIYAELKNPKNSARQFEAFLEPLLKADFRPAAEYAMRLLARRNRNLPSPREYVLAAATQLLVHKAQLSWPAVWKSITDDDQFGIDLFLNLARYGFTLDFYAALDSARLGELYNWLEQKFPANSERREAGWVTPRDSVGHLRDAVLTHLVRTGTEESVAALRSAARQLADRKWLVYQILEAEHIMRAKTWSPLSAGEIVRMTESSGVLIVQSVQQLADVVVDALRRYVGELHREQPAASDLWAPQLISGLLMPVDEPTLSDHIQRFLRRDLAESGIILNREVEISRVPGASMGKRTDIKVDAIPKPENSASTVVITTVIETKGCWNQNLLTDMETQLVNDYLVRLAAPVGIYAVGWFDKPKWDDADYRKSRTPDWTIDEAQRRLKARAETLPPAFTVLPVVLDCHAP